MSLLLFIYPLFFFFVFFLFTNRKKKKKKKTALTFWSQPGLAWIAAFWWCGAHCACLLLLCMHVCVCAADGCWCSMLQGGVRFESSTPETGDRKGKGRKKKQTKREDKEIEMIQNAFDRWRQRPSFFLGRGFYVHMLDLTWHDMLDLTCLAVSVFATWAFACVALKKCCCCCCFCADVCGWLVTWRNREQKRNALISCEQAQSLLCCCCTAALPVRSVWWSHSLTLISFPFALRVVVHFVDRANDLCHALFVVVIQTTEARPACKHVTPKLTTIFWLFLHPFRSFRSLLSPQTNIFFSPSSARRVIILFTNHKNKSIAFYFLLIQSKNIITSIYNSNVITITYCLCNFNYPVSKLISNK